MPASSDLSASFTPDSVASAYAFFHQKWRVYERSALAWQRDDIEYAIGQYVAGMSPALYEALARGRAGFLLSHARFAEDMVEAVDRLEAMLG